MTWTVVRFWHYSPNVKSVLSFCGHAHPVEAEADTCARTWRVDDPPSPNERVRVLPSNGRG